MVPCWFSAGGVPERVRLTLMGDTKEEIPMINFRRWLSVTVAGVAAASLGGMALAATVRSSPLLQSPLYGNIPKVTVRGVASATAPWVLDGKVTLTRTYLRASGKWMVIPAEYMATGAIVPKAMVGTTGGFPKLVADITDAHGGHIVTTPVVLTKKGTFHFNMPLHLTGPIREPIVLIGPPGRKPHTIGAWFAASNFLKQYGETTPAMIRSWTKASHGGSTTHSSSSGSSGGW